MKRTPPGISILAAIAAALGCCSPAAYAITVSAFAPTGGNNTSNTPSQSTLRGFYFTPEVSLTVLSLGVFDVSGFDGSGDGLATDIHVGVFRDDTPPGGPQTGTLLERVTVPQGTGATLIDGFRYVDIPPLLLLAGENYEIVSFHSSSGSEGVRANAAHNPQPALGPAFGVGAQSNTYTDLDFIPRASTTGGSFGPNFRFIAIPEPSSILLMFIGELEIVGLMLRRRRT